MIDLDEQRNSNEVQPITQAEKNRIAECYASLGNSLIENDVPKITTVTLGQVENLLVMFILLI